MTDLLRGALLGALQGATEFLPVSSSGHLVVVPALVGWPTPSLSFDTAVHWATAAAVLAYFRRDWRRMLSGGMAWRPGATTPAATDLALIAVATVPAAAAGLLFRDFFEGLFATPTLAAAMLVVTGAMLTGAEVVSRHRSARSNIPPAVALFIGLAQALAIVPGISRSGATIAAGMVAGLRREEATRFSFLLAAPIVIGAGSLQLAHFVRGGAIAGDVAVMAVGAAAALVVGYAAIELLLDFVRRRPLLPFAAYTAALGLAAIWLLSRPG